ncbi:hypothetical protein [Arthrobacter sp. UYCu723]
MAQVDNLNQGQLGALIRRIEKLERGTPVNNAAIGRSGLLVYGGGVITIENGGLYVTGTAEIIGRLIASGIIDFTGDVTISGPLDVTGLMTLAGDLVVASGGKITAGTIELNPDGSAKFGSMTISPAGKITSGSAEINPDGSVKFGTFLIDTAGKVTLANDMEVTAGGKIIAGETTIWPSGFMDIGPLTITPDNGFGLAGITNGAAQLFLTPNSGTYLFQFTGGAYFSGTVSAMGLKLSYADLPTTTAPANLHVDAQGVVKRSTA